MRFTYTDGRVPKVEQVCSTDKSRPAPIHSPHLSGDLAELQATDTYIAVRIPVDLDKSEATGPVDKALLTEARKAKADQVKVPKPRKPKKGEQLFPESSLLEAWPSQADLDEPSFRVGINAALLKKLADALGADEVELRFPKGGPDALKAIAVRTVDDARTPREGGAKDAVRQPEGLLMPIRLRGEQPTPKTGKTSRKASTTTSGSTDRSAAARKAVETRRRNAEAAAKGNGSGGKTKPKPASNGSGTVAAKVKAVAKGKAAKKGRESVPRSSAKSNGKPADRGKGSEARRQAALKAAATRRAKLAGTK